MCLVFELLECIGECNCSTNDKLNCLWCCIYTSTAYDENIRNHPARKMRLFVAGLMCTLMLIVVILSSIGLSYFLGSMSIQQTTSSNWQKEPIVEMKVISYNFHFKVQIDKQACDMGWTSILTYSLPQTQSGCDCTSSLQLIRKFQTGSCSNDNINYGCINYRAQNELKLDYWTISNGFYNPLQVCVRRLKGYSFQNLIQTRDFSSSSACLANETICNTFDTRYFYCVPQNEGCPIRDIQILNSQMPDSLLSSQNWTLVSNNSQVFVYISRSAVKMPYVEFFATEGNGICQDETQRSKNNLPNSDYILNTPQATNCALDGRFQLISQTNERDLIYANNIQNIVRQTRPYYPIENNQNIISLFGRNQILWFPDCRGRYYQIYIDAENQMKNMLIAESTLVGIACVVFLLLVFVFTNELFRCCYGCNVGCGPCGKKQFKHWMVSIRWLGQILLSCTIAYAFFTAVRVKQRYEEIEASKCTDDITQQSFKQLVDNVQNVVIPVNNSILVIFFAFQLVDCIIVWRHYYLKRLKYKFKYAKAYQMSISQKYDQEFINQQPVYNQNQQYQGNQNNQYYGQYPQQNNPQYQHQPIYQPPPQQQIYNMNIGENQNTYNYQQNQINPVQTQQIYNYDYSNPQNNPYR